MKKICVVLPAYRAEKTIRMTYDGIPKEIVDSILLVDDGSDDRTVEVSKELGIRSLVHKENMGYGANQKTCYKEALKSDSDIFVMLHPDYQYEPLLVPALASMVASGVYDVALGSRILCGSAVRGGMPIYKYVSNRILTLIQNITLHAKLSEYHTGYRAFSRRVLETLPLLANSDDFIFDNQMLTQAIFFGFRIGEISCPAKYFDDGSSISFQRSLKYGMGVLVNSVSFRLCKLGLKKSKLFDESPAVRLGGRDCSSRNNRTR